MALKAIIYKAVVNVADMDRNQFLDASPTLARHPSETQERMMLRLLVWIKYADERLQFTRGLSADDELDITAIRAQGAGGQHVNKTSTTIHLHFDIRASGLPEYFKTRLLEDNHHLITADGVVIINAQQYRSQEMNREAAIARLVVLIRELTTEQKSRRATRPTRASKERRRTQKSQKSVLKSLRGKVRRPIES